MTDLYGVILRAFRFLTYDTYLLQRKFIYYAEYLFATQLLWNTRYLLVKRYLKIVKEKEKKKNKKCEKFYRGVKLCYQLKAVEMLTIKPFLISSFSVSV